MVETRPETEYLAPDREYILYRSAVQDFALACIFNANVLYGNPLKAGVTRPFKPVETENIAEQLVIREVNTALTDRFFRSVGIFHSSLGNHDTARVWAQHIKWPLTRFDALMVIAEHEKSFGKDTKETVESAKHCLEVPIMNDWLKPELAASWARLALYANDIQKSPTTCLNIAKFILDSLHPNATTQPPEEDLDGNSLYACVARAYLAIAQVEGKLGFDFESSLKSAYEFVNNASVEEEFDISLRTIIVKHNIGAPFGDDINRAKKLALGSQDALFSLGIVLNRLLKLARVEFNISLSPEDTIQLARTLAFEQKKAAESFWGLIEIAQFEQINRFDSTKTLSLANQVKELFDRAYWDELERVIDKVKQTKSVDEDFVNEDSMTVDQAQGRLKPSKDSYHRWFGLLDLIKARIKEGIPSAKVFDEAEVLLSSFESGFRVSGLLRLAELAAEAGINPLSYTDKARHIVYLKMIKSYKTGDMLEEITKAEIKVAETLMKRCYPILAQMGQAEVEALTHEAIRLHDRDCIRALGAFLPLAVQDKFASEETKNLLLAGRAIRGVW